MSAPDPVAAHEEASKVIPIAHHEHPPQSSAPSLFTSPAGELPPTAEPPATDGELAANKQKVEESGVIPRALKTVVEFLDHHSNNAVKFLDYLSNNSVRLAGFPLFWLGSALLVFGTGAALFVLATTMSIDAVLVGPALAALMLGGLLRELGRAMRDGTDLSTALGNILYVPLRYFIRLSV